MDLLERIGRLVRDVGFPIAVAVFLLVRLDPAVRELTAAVELLSARIAVVIERGAR